VTPGNVEFVQVVCSMTVNTGCVGAVLYADERRSSAGRRAVSWLPATRDAAVLGAFLFGWLYGGPALLIHFIKSRRSLAGVGLGLLSAVLLVVADIGAQLGAEAAIEWLGL
jgi:hypothetical protein